MSTDGRISLQQGFVLHRKSYRDTSLLVEVFSREHGRVGLVAKGVRGRRSSRLALLQPFQPLLLSWSGRGELYTLTGAEADGPASLLQGEAVLSGFYVNELLMRLLPRHDPHAQLYASYCTILTRLAGADDPEWALRLFERDLLQELGYGLQLTHEPDSHSVLEPETCYAYHPEFGPQRSSADAADALAVHGATLLALDSGRCDGQRTRREAKRLMRSILHRYLGGRPLATRELFKTHQSLRRQGESTGNHEE